MVLFDTHCHLSEYDDKELENIIEVCQRENIYICSMSVDLEDYRRNLEYSRYRNVYIGFGVHPYEAHKIVKDKNWIDNIRVQLKSVNDKTVFLGEVGLDFYRMSETKDAQIEVFEYFVNLAFETGLPLSIHSRGAENEVCRILLKYQKNKSIKAVFHCFNSTDVSLARIILDNNWVFGIGGIITFKKSEELRRLIRFVYDSRGTIFCETDSPYLTPEPHRGKKNYPYYVKIIYDYLTSFLGKEFYPDVLQYLSIK